MNKLLIVLLGIVLFSVCLADENNSSKEQQEYQYLIRNGDTPKQIALLFTGNDNFDKIAKNNGLTNLNLLSGKLLKVPVSSPVKTLKSYLQMIYDLNSSKAYSMLCSESQSNFTLQAFTEATKEMTFYDLNSLEVCADSAENNTRQLCIKASIEEDPGQWSFNLIWEKKVWRILLYDLNPTFPQNDGALKCK